MQHSSPLLRQVQSLLSGAAGGIMSVKSKQSQKRESLHGGMLWDLLLPLAAQRVGVEKRRVQIYLCFRDMTVNPPEKKRSQLKSIQFNSADLCSACISISKGRYLHHSSFVRWIFQFLSCCVTARSELFTVMVENLINKITACFIFVFACHSDERLTCPGAVQTSHRHRSNEAGVTCKKLDAYAERAGLMGKWLKIRNEAES